MLDVAGGAVEGQMVVVVRATDAHLVVALCHPYQEYTGHSDVVVLKAATGLRFDLVVCSTIIAAAACRSLRVKLGAIPSEVALQISTPGVELKPGDNWWQGPRVGSWPFDARHELRRHLTARARVIGSSLHSEDKYH